MNLMPYGLSLAACLCAISAVQADNGAPLTANALAQCAAQVGILREESARLHARLAASERKRAELDVRSAELKARRDAVDPDDLNASLAAKSSIDLHQGNIAHFNTQVEQLKADIVSINKLKQLYDGSCASRSYRRSDFAKLSTNAQAAMKAGLTGVQIPYLGDRATAGQ